MNQILYLDFDGVLHPEDVWVRPGGSAYIRSPSGHVLFEHADLLADLLKPYPSLRVVLSTSWVRHYRYARTVQFLPAPLAARCVGATYHSEMNRTWFEQLPRGAQVLGDVQRRKPSQWLAVDDVDEGWTHAQSQVVITHPIEGIAHPPVRAALMAALARFKEPS